MKKQIFLFSFITIILSSCIYRVNKTTLPPGQAKKLSGSKSAKAYAPGQRNKYYRDN